MTIAVDVKRTDNLNTGKLVCADVTLDDAYPTGGYAVTPAQFGLDQIHQIIVGAPAIGGIVGSYDNVGVMKLKFWQSTTGAPALFVQVASLQDVLTSVCPVLVFGS